RRITRSFAAAVEHEAAGSDPLRAHSLLESLFNHYKKAGMREEATELIGRVKYLGRQAEDVMVEFRVPMTINLVELTDFADSVTPGGVQQAVLRLCTAFVPNVAEIREALKQMAVVAPLYSLVTRTRLDGLTRARVGGLPEDEEGRLVEEIATHVRCAEPF